ncbi:MAG: hypothetical protein VB018_03560 [Lachnospiraceae bacterium]|nr:hypothetical protein [Lachnospiraceae bacterium]
MSYVKKIVTDVKYNVCIDDFVDDEVIGKFYHCFSDEPEVFKTSLGMINSLDKVMDMIDYPQKTTKSRIFKAIGLNEANKVKELRKIMSETDVMKNRGEKATFIVEIKYRENATWQGTVKWVEENKEQNFRSALELIKLIDSASEFLGE